MAGNDRLQQLSNVRLLGDELRCVALSETRVWLVHHPMVGDGGPRVKRSADTGVA